MRSSAVAGVALLLLLTAGCGSDDEPESSASDGSDSPSEEAPASGTYSSEPGPNGEQVTLEVEEGTITRVQATVFGECEGATVTQELDSQVEVPIEDDGSVEYSSESGTADIGLSGTLDGDTIEGTFSYQDPSSACEVEPLDFTATAG